MFTATLMGDDQRPQPRSIGDPSSHISLMAKGVRTAL
jgi:hypothetical protein